MIATLDMRPHHGSLVSDGVRLDFQVEEGQYRVDFLVNQWLVVEIDGAAYHSSPEAKMRDARRDRYFEGLGYSVLRIPAKIIFQNVKEAVDQVQAALKIGRREVLPSEPVARTGFQRLANTASSISKNIEKSEKKFAVRNAVAEATGAYSAEESALKAAFEIASSRLEHHTWVSNLNADRLECYQQSVRDLQSALGDAYQGPALNVKPRKFVRPKATGDEWIDEQISVAFSHLETKREKCLSEAKARIQQNPSIRPYVESALVELGRADLWDTIK